MKGTYKVFFSYKLTDNDITIQRKHPLENQRKYKLIEYINDELENHLKIHKIKVVCSLSRSASQVSTLIKEAKKADYFLFFLSANYFSKGVAYDEFNAFKESHAVIAEELPLSGIIASEDLEKHYCLKTGKIAHFKAYDLKSPSTIIFIYPSKYKKDCEKLIQQIGDDIFKHRRSTCEIYINGYELLPIKEKIKKFNTCLLDHGLSTWAPIYQKNFLSKDTDASINISEDTAIKMARVIIFLNPKHESIEKIQRIESLKSEDCKFYQIDETLFDILDTLVQSKDEFSNVDELAEEIDRFLKNGVL